MKIISSAPGKLILFGEHASSRGKPAIVLAVNSRIEIMLKPHNYLKKNILITSKDFDAIKLEYPNSKLGLVSKAISNFLEVANCSAKPFELIINSKIKPGFGSSSAVIIATLGILNEYYHTNYSKEYLLKLGLQTNLAVKGYGSGLDIASSLYGGLIKYQLNKKPKPLPYDALNFVVGSTGIKESSESIVNDVKKFEENNSLEAEKIFNGIANIVIKAEDAITSSNLPLLGKLMNENQAFLRKINVSSHLLEDMIKASLDNGAFGAKLSGAGRGDNMIALVSQKTKKKVINAINKSSGYAVKHFSIEPIGLVTKIL